MGLGRWRGLIEASQEVTPDEQLETLQCPTPEGTAHRGDDLPRQDRDESSGSGSCGSASTLRATTTGRVLTVARRRLTLTAAHVESLPAIAGARTEYIDAIVPELALRVSPHSSRTWSVRFWQGRGRAGRRAVRVTMGPTSRLGLAAARAEARTILERLSRGQPTQPERGLTVNALLSRCLDALDLRDTTRREWSRLALVEIGPSLGARLAADLRRAEVRQGLRGVGGRSAPHIQQG